MNDEQMTILHILVQPAKIPKLKKPVPCQLGGSYGLF
jgi:hypothetical protein